MGRDGLYLERCKRMRLFSVRVMVKYIEIDFGAI